MTEQQSDTEQSSDKGRGRNFFAIDKGRWSQVCSVGLNEAVAYLVLACFSGKTNADTAASVHAIETYTNISRSRARDAIESLKTNRLIRQTKAGSHPRYELLEAGQPGTGGKKPKPGEPVADNWIWLPNALVTGAATEIPPVELCRQTQNTKTLKLFVELYDATNLRDDGGISRRLVFCRYERHRLGQQGGYVVWGFAQDGTRVYTGAKHAVSYKRPLTPEEKATGSNDSLGWWEAYSPLEKLGLIEDVSYLWESEDEDAEPIHPCGVGRTDSLEDRIGWAAHRAGAALLTPGQVDHAISQGLWVVPVREHRQRVCMVGVKRLRYRPQTSKTSAWYADLQENGRKWLATYEQLLAQKTESAHPASA